MLPATEGTFFFFFLSFFLFLLAAVQSKKKRHLSCLMSQYTGNRVVDVTCNANECID